MRVYVLRLLFSIAALLAACSVSYSQVLFPLIGELSDDSRITLEPLGGSLRVGKESAWRLTLELPDDFEVVSLRFDARMPDHGHGLPHPATVVATDDSRVYRIDDVLFNMAGRWVISVWVGHRAGIELATFDVNLDRAGNRDRDMAGFSPTEVALIQSLALSAADAVVESPEDPTNILSGNPAAVRLGRDLFFDAQLSATQKVACVTCHEPGLGFSDGKQLSVGSKVLARNAPGLLGIGNGAWFYWDGRRDSLWAQALTPLETPGEMDNTRTSVARYVTTRAAYRARFADLSGVRVALSDPARYPRAAGPFAPSPAGRALWFAMPAGDRARVEQVFVAVGKILAAYVETLDHPATRFDLFAAALDSRDANAANALISAAERRGAKLFLDSNRTHCLRCHNGPSLTNHGFHAIGSQAHFLDLGRQFGLDAARVDPFNCTGPHSDARDTCALTAMAGVAAADFAGAFKVPTLRNLAFTAPYFHDGRFATLREVMAFYLDPPSIEAGNHEAPALDLNSDEVEDLIAFLQMLTAEPAAYSSMAR